MVTVYNSSYESGLHTHDCGIQITDPMYKDQGLWRCALETTDETYYGHLKVWSPWVLRDPEIAASVITEPTLTADVATVRHLTEDSVSMSCSVQSAIRYCYFRAQNGSVFNVGPGQSHDLATYVGAGFDAGECGIRFPSLAVRDTGSWSCHVGFLDEDQPEQIANISVTIDDTMVVAQRMVNTQLHIEAQVYDHRELEYCRFVRIDGLGFVGSNMPDGYFSIQSLATGRCGLVVDQPTMIDHHPWTVVARVKGQDVEHFRVTIDSIEDPVNGTQNGNSVRMPFGWILFMALGFSIMLILAISPKKNREWTYTRASAMRNSFRNSFMRKQAKQNITTANAA